MNKNMYEYSDEFSYDDDNYSYYDNYLDNFPEPEIEIEQKITLWISKYLTPSLFFIGLIGNLLSIAVLRKAEARTSKVCYYLIFMGNFCPFLLNSKYF